MYRTKEYSERPLSDIKKEIDLVSTMDLSNRVFLADGDALNLPTDKLIEILRYIRLKLPKTERVSCYAMPRNLLQKSERDLALLHSEGLSLVYVGIESGNDLILRKVTKGALSSSIIEACQKASRSGFNLSCMVILGLGGKKYTSHHVSDTARILSRISPQYAAALSLSLEDDIYSEFMEKFGESFQPLDDIELIDELERLITEISPNSPIIFRANHASNIYSVGGLIPNDRERMLETIRSIRKRPNIWKPKYLRRF